MQQHQRGLALVDMLVGLALGAMVVAAALAALGMSRQASGSVGEVSLLHTQGAFALRVIGRHLRQAGSLEPTREATNGLYAFNDRFAGFGGGTTVATGTDGTGTAADTLSVSHQDAGASDAHRLDCLSEVVRTGDRIDSTFFVRSGELRCRTAAKNQALIAHVADFQVMYRIRDATRGTRRQTATQLTAQGLWQAVHAVEICLELKGELPTAASGTASYRDCHGADMPRLGRQRLVLRQLFDLRTQAAP